MGFLLACLAGLLALAAAMPSVPDLPLRVPEDNGDLPDEFDARTTWPHCDSIGTIYDIGSCHASMVYSVVATIMDRYCIHKDLLLNISAQDLLTCCKFCKVEPTDRPCDGMNSNGFAWEYWKSTGIVTGSVYNSESGCRPYNITPCDHYESGPLPPCPDKYGGPVQNCVQQCEKGYPTSYKNDKHRGRKVYQVGPDFNVIKKELMTNGPIQSGVFFDKSFFHYRKGVYKSSGFSAGLVFVKIIGWGKDSAGEDYWLCSNFWNTDWGDKGTFKIAISDTLSLITKMANAGIP